MAWQGTLVSGITDGGCDSRVCGGEIPNAAGPLLVLANFSEHPQAISTDLLHAQGLSWPAQDLIASVHVVPQEALSLSPYQLAWLKPG